MPDIKYVVFSDMHLGAENSLLTNLKDDTPQTDTTQPGPVLKQLMKCLGELINKNESTGKPKLILNGDVAELALTTTNKACMAFQRFIELAMPESGDFLFDKNILFLPGNHDHCLWEYARDSYYNDSLKNIPPGEYIPNEFHSTKIFSPEYIPSHFFNSLIQSHPYLGDVSVRVSYPAHGVINKDRSKCIIFCHGHYIESMYWLMTTLRSQIFPERRPPDTFEEIEIENYAWVDFFWSTLGRSGSVGKDINLIYDKLQDAAQVNKMISNIAESIAKKKRNPVVRWLEKKGLKIILEHSLGRMAANERNEPDVELTPDAMSGLETLMEVPMLNQLNQELNNDIPDDLTFIFGHTHKPFCRWMHFDGYQNKVKIYNTGGWVVDTLNRQPLHGGSVILIDENLHVILLQIYKEGNYKVTLNELQHDHSRQNINHAFHERIDNQIRNNSESWVELERVIERQVNIRYKNLAEIIREQ